MDKDIRQFIEQVMNRSQHCDFTMDSHLTATWLMDEVARLEQIELFEVEEAHAKNIINKKALYEDLAKKWVMQMYQTQMMMDAKEKSEHKAIESARREYNLQLELDIIKKHNPNLIIPPFEKL